MTHKFLEVYSENLQKWILKYRNIYEFESKVQYIVLWTKHLAQTSALLRAITVSATKILPSVHYICSKIEVINKMTYVAVDTSILWWSQAVYAL